MEANDPLPRQLVLTAKAMRERFEQALAAEGGSLATWIVLNHTTAEGAMIQRELATRMRIEGATLTRHLDRMEGEGLIARGQHPTDRRATVIEVTAAGRSLHQRLLGVARRAGALALAGLTDRDRRTLERLLSRIQDNLQEPER